MTKVNELVIGEPVTHPHPAVGMNIDGNFPADVKRRIRTAQVKWRASGMNKDPKERVYITWIPYNIYYDGSSLHGKERGDALTKSESVKRAKKALIKALKGSGATNQQIKLAIALYW